MTVNIISSRKLQENTEEKRSFSPTALLKSKVRDFLHREIIDPDVILKHNQALETSQTLQIMAKALEHKKFKEKDFIILLQIRNKFAEGIGQYKGINNYLRRFKVAIEAKNSFLSIEQIELLYRTSHQQNFYQLVFKLLEQNVCKEKFYQLIHHELTELLPKIRTEKGKKALEVYVHALDSLTHKDDLGLQLLYRFKKDQLTNYSILQKVSTVVNTLKDQDIKKRDDLIKIVKKHEEIFTQLGKIIEIPDAKNEPSTYVTMLQYIILKGKYAKIYCQFEKLVQVLGDWNKFYKTVESIRREYCWKKYHQPQDFKAKLVMLDLYKKYHYYC